MRVVGLYIMYICIYMNWVSSSNAFSAHHYHDKDMSIKLNVLHDIIINNNNILYFYACIKSYNKTDTVCAITTSKYSVFMQFFKPVQQSVCIVFQIIWRNVYIIAQNRLQLEIRLRRSAKKDQTSVVRETRHIVVWL